MSSYGGKLPGVTSVLLAHGPHVRASGLHAFRQFDHQERILSISFGLIRVCIAGLAYPVLASAAGGIWIAGRYVYSKG